MIPIKLKYIYLVVVLLVMHLHTISAQGSAFVYRTPSGTRYHTAHCRMVDNTSNSILRTDAIANGMLPCSFCKPDSASSTKELQPESLIIKPGQKEEATQCLGITQKGFRCERKTRNANGYCFQHLPKERT